MLVEPRVDPVGHCRQGLAPLPLVLYVWVPEHADLRLAYLAVSNAFTVLRLLPMSDREKDAEILRHQLAVLERPLGMEKARLTPSDRPELSRGAAALTVHSSDGKRSPGPLSRQGPEVLRWLLFEAAKTSARVCAPGYRYYTDVKSRGGCRWQAMVVATATWPSSGTPYDFSAARCPMFAFTAARAQL
ncbi:MAG: hypothetical protein QOE61_2527 [Micromonosporaceae bacterium]|nr:hypothetical protein [Micromonosporaceae bacterium]